MEHSNDQQVISIIPSAKTYYGRAMIAYEKKDFERARHHFKTGISLARTEEEKVFGRVQLALVYQHSFKFQESIELFDALLKEKPKSYPEAYFFQATNYLHLKEYETALTMLDHYIESYRPGIYIDEALEMKKMIETESTGK